MNELKQSIDHHAFIVNTDRKSLYAQLKNLVQQAEAVASKELLQRRNTLKLFLESEDQMYEEEFTKKVESRIDEDIKERKDKLLKIKEERTRNELEFLKSKRIQQHMNSCYQIREAFRQKETRNVKECQLEQMLQKERAAREEQELKTYWLKVQGINLQLMDDHQKQEDCLKKLLVEHVAATRKVQLKALEEKNEKEYQDKLKEKIRIDDLLKKLRLKESDRKMQRKPCTELLKMIKNKRDTEIREKEENSENHRKMMCAIERLESEGKIAIANEKKAFTKATTDYIEFVKGLHLLEEQRKKISENRTEELRRVDLCTKYNISLERERKASKAEQCFAALRQQISEQLKSRSREEAQYRECKILENRFVHKEISREEILSKKQENRKQLEKQIVEIQKMQEAEDTKFSKDLKRASNDPEFCAELAKKYIGEGTDYLAPHPDFCILCTPSKEYVAESSAPNM